MSSNVLKAGFGIYCVGMSRGPFIWLKVTRLLPENRALPWQRQVRGATNTVTGIANAFMDSTSLVVITGQVPQAMKGTMAFREIDIVGITRPCTKYSFSIAGADEVAEIVREAFYIARSGRPGPVLIDIPKDVTAEMAWYDDPAVNDQLSVPSAPKSLKHPDVSAALRKIRAASRPVIYAGGGVNRSSAAAELLEFATLLDLPVATTLMGLGVFPALHSNSLGMLGMHGHYAANCALSDADLIIAIGVRFDDRVTGNIEKFAPGAEIIHIDIDASSVRQNIKVHVSVTGDAKGILRQMLDLLNKMERQDINTARDFRGWWSEIRRWQRDVPLAYTRSDSVIKPKYLCQELARLTDNNAIIATDVGQHQMWLAQYYGFRRMRQSITSGGLGTMGFGLTAALGAQIAFPEAQVIAFVGDGGFQMTSQELATAVKYGTNLKMIVMNNSNLGMVRQWQELHYEKNFSEVDLTGGPDFVKLAEAYGAKGLRASHPLSLGPGDIHSMPLWRR